MPRNNEVALAIGAGVVVWLWSDYGTPTRQKLLSSLKGITLPSLGTDDGTPSSLSSGSPASSVTAPITTRPDASIYHAFRVRLPTSELNQQIWVHHQRDGHWEYVDSPASFGKFGIASDMGNVTDIVWGSARAFTAPRGNVDGASVEWVRSDTPTGVTGLYPDVPSDFTAALRASFASGRLIPAGPVGYAILKQQGIS